MPSSIFDILRIHILMKLKLSSAVFVLACVIKGDSELPVLRGMVGLELDLSFEVGDRVRDAPLTEMLFSSKLQYVRRELVNMLLRRLIKIVCTE